MDEIVRKERNELSRNIFRILDGEVLKDANKTHIVTNKILALLEGWKSPEEFKEELNLKVDTFIMRVGGSHDKG
jgi:hypothetical protein